MFDITTGQWCSWVNKTSPSFSGQPDNTFLRQHCGVLVSTIGGPSNTKTLMVDSFSNEVFQIDQDYKYDDVAGTDQFEPIVCQVTAGLPMRMRERMKCNELYLVGSVGNPSVYSFDSTIVEEDSFDLVNENGSAFYSFTFFPTEIYDGPFSSNLVLEISDDNGKTWWEAGSFPVIKDDFEQELVWRSLGQVRSPGRIFRLTDYNILQRLDGFDMR